MSNVSALNDSININKNDSYSASNLQNASLTSNKIASHLNTSLLQEIEKSSMQIEAVCNNNDNTESSTPKNNSNMSSETIVQKITENLKQLSEIRDNAQEYFSTKSPIDNQLNRNKTESAHPIELSSLSVNATDE